MLGAVNGPITQPSYPGFIDSTHDALILFEAAWRGICPKITRRLQDKERYLIRSGSCFIFDEKESGIKRWTDGLLWSPSRILGNFLIYRELDSREPSGRGTGLSAQDVSPRTGGGSGGGARDRRPSESTYRFKNNGLVKKTISLHDMHIICYYRVTDVVNGLFRHPSASPELTALDIDASFLTNNNFRCPIKVEYGPDGVLRFAGEVDDSKDNNSKNDASSSALPFQDQAGQPSRRRSPKGTLPSVDPTAYLAADPHLAALAAAGSLDKSFYGSAEPTQTARPPSNRPSTSRSQPNSIANTPQNARYEPYPSRPPSLRTAPGTPASWPESSAHPAAQHLGEPWVAQSTLPRRGSWNTTSSATTNYYVPQQAPRQDASDPRLGQFAPYEPLMVPPPQPPPHHHHQQQHVMPPSSQSSGEWQAFDVLHHYGHAQASQGSSGSAPSSGSSRSSELPFGDPIGLEIASHQASPTAPGLQHTSTTYTSPEAMQPAALPPSVANFGNTGNTGSTQYFAFEAPLAANTIGCPAPPQDPALSAGTPGPNIPGELTGNPSSWSSYLGSDDSRRGSLAMVQRMPQSPVPHHHHHQLPSTPANMAHVANRNSLALSLGASPSGLPAYPNTNASGVPPPGVSVAGGRSFARYAPNYMSQQFSQVRITPSDPFGSGSSSSSMNGVSGLSQSMPTRTAPGLVGGVGDQPQLDATVASDFALPDSLPSNFRSSSSNSNSIPQQQLSLPPTPGHEQQPMLSPWHQVLQGGAIAPDAFLAAETPALMEELHQSRLPGGPASHHHHNQQA